jgi:heterodisulfide reductase subunit B2
MTIGYYPGCSLHGTALEYDESLRAVAKVFEIQFKEVEDWNCCGATAAHSLNHILSVALPARILALAEAQGFSEIVVPCAACYSRLISARHDFLSDPKIRKAIPEIIEMPFEGKVEVLSVIDFLNKHIIPNVKDKIKQPFLKKAACYYGCLMVRPQKLTHIEDYENPMMMEDMIKKIGGTPIDWAFKVECCGAGLSVSRTDVVARLSGKIVEDAVDRGAETIIVACPMCQSNLDMRRPEIDAYLKRDTKVPVIFITQAIGIALGLSEKELGLQRHLTSAASMMIFDKTIEAVSKPQTQKAGV